MSTAQFTCPLIVTVPGQLIASSLWNNEFLNLFDNINPQGVGAYSDTDTQMQTDTDPFPGSVTSRATAMSGELERLRYTIRGCKGTTYWYDPPDDTLNSLNTRVDADETNITALQARFPVITADIAANAITEAKLAPLSVGTPELIALSVTDAKINDVSATKITGTLTQAQIAEFTKFNVRIQTNLSNVTGDGTVINPVIFNTADLNQGSGYNTGTGIFTAPTTRNYLFSVQLFLKGTASPNIVELSIITTSRTYVSETTPASDSSIGFTLIVPMVAGDTAKINLKVAGGGKVVSIGGDSSTSSVAGFASFWSGSLLP